MKRKYRLKQTLVEDIEAYFNTPYATNCPTYTVYKVQMRVLGMWITIKSFDGHCEWLMREQSQQLLEMLNE